MEFKYNKAKHIDQTNVPKFSTHNKLKGLNNYNNAK